MSTPVNQLPQQVNPNMVPPLEEDQEVMDVIKGMESEFQPTQSPHASQSMAAVQNSLQFQPVQLQPAPPIKTELYAPPSSSVSKFGLDMDLLKRAGIVALLALVIFYPTDLSSLYDRSPYLQKLAPYDKIVRAIVLLVIVYIIMSKFNM